MTRKIGRSYRLSLPQRLLGELLQFARNVPAHTLHRRMRLGAVVAARQAASPQPGWAALFVKAYALLAARRPNLRRLYISSPWPRLYEHPETVAVVPVTRTWGDEEAVFFARLHGPQRLGLAEIDAALRCCQQQPLEANPDYCRQLRVASLPWPLRRLVWWYLQRSGPLQAEYLGTFGCTSVAALGASGPHAQTPWTAALHYDVLAADGTVNVGITYDQRVRTGATVARFLADLEEVLQGEILNELGYLRDLAAA